MKKYPSIFFLFIVSLISINSRAQSDSAIIKNLFDEVLKNGKCFDDLTYLTTKIGGRLAGSPEAASAVAWGKKAMEEIQPDSVYLQECMVPHWVRGEKEFAEVFRKAGDARRRTEVKICALGGSIATPDTGIMAEVIEVHSLDEVAKLGRDIIKGKIVFYNRPMDVTLINTFDAYGGAVDQRGGGANMAASYGAVATIVRSMSNTNNDYPHTGAMRKYVDSIPKIPACAISTNDANLLSDFLKGDKHLKFHFKMSCKTLPDEKSYNVVGEIKGTEHPEEIIVFGGHLDSWETGKGAHDDGAGVVQTIEVLRMLKQLRIRPKRTIRGVLFINEENGLRGGLKYAELAKKNNEHHIAAIETDRGGFVPRGFGFSVKPEQFNKILIWKPLLMPYGLCEFDTAGGGSDISPLKEMGVPQMELLPDSERYFYVHHAATDVIENVNERELKLGAASMGALVYLLSEYGL
jgi:carboxypeptidase Q